MVTRVVRSVLRVFNRSVSGGTSGVDVRAGDGRGFILGLGVDRALLMLNCRFFGNFSSAFIGLMAARFRLRSAAGFCFLPLNPRLIASKSARSSLPSAIALPRAMHLSSCSGVMFFMAGDTSLLVHGRSMPIALSRMMRAKQ